MLKLTKKADYGLIAMRHLAEHADLGACSAKDLAEMYAMPQEALELFSDRESPRASQHRIHLGTQWNSRRVEERRGSVCESTQPVSLPRSSNRTCGFPTSGFPTGFGAQ